MILWCVGVYRLHLAQSLYQGLDIVNKAVTNAHETIEELLDASFSMWPVSYQGKQAISSAKKFLFQNKESRLKMKCAARYCSPL
jgi:hypothetical protein